MTSAHSRTPRNEDEGLLIQRPNRALPLDLKWVRRLSVDDDEVKRKERSLRRRRGPREEALAEVLLDLIHVIDLTTLSGDDTVSRVRALCQSARSPLSRDLRGSVAVQGSPPRVAAVCVFPAFLPEVLEALEGTEIRVATVAGGFPHGLSPLRQRVAEVAAAVEGGAQEVDVVIRREWPLTGKWDLLHEELTELRAAAGQTHMKVILGTGEHETLNQIARSALTAMLAGADFVKTSTGKERVNATLSAGLAMAQAVREFRTETKVAVGVKPAGGIRTAAEALRWRRLLEGELGPEWTGPSLFRIGASGLLGNIVTTLEGVALSTG